ncbi:Structural maintenance of chromosomes protein 6 [Tritrichomonas musculus]|uniref:Structural maintenance of chromosomes protein 6 n=1 Tax=Tritrichomonas musculus TaxID=1915356 RepID=A0ABR2K057_9EUKA
MNNLSDSPSGVILSIQMINFMKHDNFLINFTPHVNFITGRNGSGKSSILVALTIGLGGTSRTSGRGTNLSDLIKDGRHEATIIIQIKNTPGGYEELKYGPIITITRRIRFNSSSFEINNFTRKDQVREELNQILQFFSIQVDNPCTVMNQDIAREFIGISTPQRKYELFMKGTLLSRLEDEIYKIKGNLNNIERLKEERKSEMADIDRQLDEKKRLYDIVSEFDDIFNRIHSLEDEIVWSQYLDEKKETDKLQKYIEENKDYLKIQIKRVEDQKEQCTLVDIKLSKAEERIRNKLLELASLKKEKENIELLKNQNSCKLSDKKGKLKVKKNKLENIEKDIENKNQDLTRLSKRRENADEEIHRKRSIFVAEQEDKRDLLMKQLSTIDSQIEQIKIQIHQASSDYEISKGTVNSYQNRYENMKQKLSALVSLSSDGHKDMSIQTLIDKNINQFSYRPIGPIGHFIRIKDEKWGIAAQNIFGKFLKSFIVNSYQDERTIRKMLPEKVSIITTDFLIPSHLDIASIPFSNCINALESIEISSFDIQSVNGPTVNSVDIITKIFYDVLRVDQIWIFEDPRDAQKASVRYNISAITLTGATFKVQSGYEMKIGAKFTECKIGLDDKIRIQRLDSETKRMKSEIQQKISIAENIYLNYRKLKDKKNELHSQRDETTKELNMIEYLLKNPPEDEFDYDTQIKNLKDRIDTLKKEQDECKKSIADLEEDIRPLKLEKEKYKNDIQQLSEKLKKTDPLTEEVEQLRKEKISSKAKLQSEEIRQRQFEDKIKKIEESVKEARAKEKSDLEKARAMYPAGEEKYKDNWRPAPTLVTLLLNERNKYKEIQKQKNIDFTAIQNDYHQLKKQHDIASRYLTELDEFIVTANTALEMRIDRINKMRKSYTRRAKVSFLHYQNKRKFVGKLHFDHNEKELSIKVKSKNDLFFTDVSELSGGEKSFALVSLLLSLWSLMDTPFFAIDEFDVFMDDINRQAAMSLLIEGAKKMENKQFIFITPLSLNSLKTDELISIFEIE